MRNGRGRPGWWQKRIKNIRSSGSSFHPVIEYEIVEQAKSVIPGREGGIASALLHTAKSYEQEERRQHEEARRDAIRTTYRKNVAWRQALALNNQQVAADVVAFREWLATKCADLVEKRGMVHHIQRRMRQAGFPVMAARTIRAHLREIRKRRP